MAWNLTTSSPGRFSKAREKRPGDKVGNLPFFILFYYFFYIPDEFYRVWIKNYFILFYSIVLIDKGFIFSGNWMPAFFARMWLFDPFPIRKSKYFGGKYFCLILPNYLMF